MPPPEATVPSGLLSLLCPVDSPSLPTNLRLQIECESAATLAGGSATKSAVERWYGVRLRSRIGEILMAGGGDRLEIFISALWECLIEDELEVIRDGDEESINKPRILRCIVECCLCSTDIIHSDVVTLDNATHTTHAVSLLTKLYSTKISNSKHPLVRLLLPPIVPSSPPLSPLPTEEEAKFLASTDEEFLRAYVMFYLSVKGWTGFFLLQDGRGESDLGRAYLREAVGRLRHIDVEYVRGKWAKIGEVAVEGDYRDEIGRLLGFV